MSRTVSTTFLFTDLVGSTRMLERLGPAGDELLRRHFTLLRSTLTAHGGREVKNLGDGLMVTFATPAAGAACAAAMQRAIAQHNATSAAEFALSLRVGVHSGDAVSDGDDYFGMPVVIAKRLCDRCDSGQVLVSEAVRDVAGAAGLEFADMGSLWLKGLSDPVPAAALDWDAVAAHGLEQAEASENVPSAAGPAMPAPLTTLATRELIGRRSELSLLRRELGQAQRGGRRLVLLAGEPGIGKTRLATELAIHAHAHGAVVLYGRCDEGGLIPFQPVVEALGRWVDQVPDVQLRRRPQEDYAALAKLLPVLRRRFPNLVESPSGDAETERYRLFEAIVALLDSTAVHGPVVLVLDDLHWADPATLLILKHLMRSPTSSNLLIIGTYRDVEVGRGHPFASVLHDLRRERVPLERVELAGLSQAEVTELITSWAGQQPPEQLTRAVWQETEGHPFFVEEVLRHLLETGGIKEAGGRLAAGTALRIGIPESVRSVVESRLARLDEQTQRVLSIGAVVGREFSAAVVEKISGLSPDQLYEHLEEAASARLVVETQGGQITYRFSHALIQDTLYERLARSHRTNLHMRVGEALEELGDTRPEQHLPGLAHHFFKAARTSEALDKAIEYAIRAAELAAGQLAYEAAAEQLENALHGLAVQGGNLGLQCDLLLSLGENLWNSGEYGQARDAFARAAVVAERMRSPSQLAAAALGLGGRMGMPLEGGMVDTLLIETLEKALRMLHGGDSPLRARMMGRLASALLFSERDKANDLGRQAIAMARRIDDPALLARILADTWLACWRVGNLDERLRTAAEMEKLAAKAESSGPLLEARFWRAATLFEAGDVVAAEQHLDHSRVLVDELRQSYYTWFHTLYEAGRAIMHGDLTVGEQLMWQAVDTGQTSDNPCAAELFAPQVLHLRILQGRCAEIHGGSKSISEHFHTIPAFRAGLACIYAELGLEPEARREFERLAVNDFADVPDDVFWISTMVLSSDVCAFLGDTRRAETLYRLLLPLADRYAVLGSVSVPVGTVQRALGAMATLLDRFSAADEHLQRAAAFEQRVGSPPELARVLCAQARMLLSRSGTGDVDRAATLLDEADELARAHRLGGIDRAVAQLRATTGGHAPAPRQRRSFGEVTDAWRYGARAMISTRGRAAMGRLVGDGTDADLEKRFGSPLALRSVMTAMARGFQPSMAFGFEGEIQFEVLPSRATERDDDRNSDHWWTIEVSGIKAVARHRPAENPAVTIRASVADFIRLIAGAVNPVTVWIDKRVQVEGDLTLGNRLVELFGGEEPLAIAAQLR
ncbi:MAG: AAA family ATPase [Jatrophihabitans sp.]|uniref:AAA family ATPase n=1 Tax=Jatrophihabitans sp. TaxID=1932789 RepID=UPI003914CC8D